MAIQEKKYCNPVIIIYKNDLRKSYGTIKQVINKRSKKSKCCQFLIHVALMDDNEIIAIISNYYIANIGPDLAKKIHNVSTRVR